MRFIPSSFKIKVNSNEWWTNTYFSAHQTRFRILSCFSNSLFFLIPQDPNIHMTTNTMQNTALKLGCQFSLLSNIFPLLCLKQEYGSCITQAYMLYFSRLFMECQVIYLSKGQEWKEERRQQQWDRSCQQASCRAMYLLALPHPSGF